MVKTLFAFHLNPHPSQRIRHVKLAWQPASLGEPYHYTIKPDVKRRIYSLKNEHHPPLEASIGLALHAGGRGQREGAAETDRDKNDRMSH